MTYKINKGMMEKCQCLLFKILFHTVMKEQLAASKNKSIILKIHNKTTVTQLSIYKVKLEHNKKHKT